MPVLPDSSPETLLLAARRFSRANFTRGLAITDDELSPAEWHLMWLLHNWSDPKGARPSELARRQMVTAANVTHQLRNLENQALIERIHDDADRRVVLVKLTPPGEKKLKQVRDSFIAHYEKLIDHIGADEAEHFVHLLVTAAEFLEHTEPPL